MSMAGLAVAIAVAARLLMAHPGAILSIPQREPRQWEFDPPSVSISADGRWVALASRAQLVPADRNASRDVYVLDRSSGVITLESRIAGDARGTDSNHPRISMWRRPGSPWCCAIDGSPRTGSSMSVLLPAAADNR